MTAKKKAYSYLRVSTQTQADEGLGLRGQEEEAKTFLQNNPDYELVDTIIDAGVSAYSGSNLLDEAGLGGFMNLVRDSRIERDSVLICSAVDRISRKGIRTAQRIFGHLLDAGINIYLSKMNILIKHDDENDISASLIVAVGAWLGWQESQQKSNRIKHTFELQRQDARQGKKLNIAIRPWLKLVDGQFEVIPEQVAILERLFSLRLQGLGVALIADHLNRENIPVLGGRVLKGKTPRWTSTAVTNHLKNRSALGEYHPKVVIVGEDNIKRRKSVEPIIGYYPAVINPDTFNAVQASFTMSAPKGKGGTYRNVFRGMIKCSCCGASISYKHNQNSGQPYLYCCGQKDRARVCEMKYFKYKPFSEALVSILGAFDYSKLQGEGASLVMSEIATLEAKQADLKQTISNYASSLSHLSGFSAQAVLTRLNEAEASLSSTEEQLAQLRASQRYTDSSDTLSNLTEYTSPDLSDELSRARYNAFLRRYIDRIVTDGDDVELHFKGVGVSLAFDISSQTPDAMRDALSTFYSNIDYFSAIPA